MAWEKAPGNPAQSAEIDRLVARELAADKIQPSLRTTEEQFLRRVMLDLTGELPVPADVTEFLADHDPHKRAKLIDKLLASEEFARHWAGYWREVIASRITDPRGRLLARSFEEWLTQEIRKGTGWNQIARAMITAEGSARADEPGKNGATFFLASHTGPDAANERAAETSRIFLGIQIQCAQCHDHPSDVWKRTQFHELAAYFVRLQPQRILRETGRPVGMALASQEKGEHRMPSKEDPKAGTITHPRFLDGKEAPHNVNDHERRRELAEAIVSPNNYWFAAAYVNRIWGELMGQSFCQPVDDMGPMKEVVLPSVLTRLAASFRATHYDIKEMFRVILNSQTYQRQIRLGESSDQHLHFAGAYPSRLPADALWQSLVGVLGNLGGPSGGARLPPMAILYGVRPGLEGLFKDEFNFDPSSKADDVEGSVPQALLLMNHPLLNQRIQARGTNLLGRILSAYPDNGAALRMLYLRTLARKPTDRELTKCRAYIDQTSNRAEAFEDILWALLNSTEFQTRR